MIDYLQIFIIQADSSISSKRVAPYATQLSRAPWCLLLVSSLFSWNDIGISWLKIYKFLSLKTPEKKYCLENWNHWFRWSYRVLDSHFAGIKDGQNLTRSRAYRCCFTAGSKPLILNFGNVPIAHLHVIYNLNSAQKIRLMEKLVFLLMNLSEKEATFIISQIKSGEGNREAHILIALNK